MHEQKMKYYEVVNHLVKRMAVVSPGMMKIIEVI